MAGNTVNLNLLIGGNTTEVHKETVGINKNMQEASKAAGTFSSNLARAASQRIGGGIAAQGGGGRGSGGGGVGGGDLPAGLGRGTAAGNVRGDSRDFARQAQGLGGLVHLYATFAANVFAVSAAFNALSKAMDVSRMEKAMEILSQRGGTSLKNLAKDMYKISDGAIAMSDSMRFASMGSAAGIASKDMKQLATIAKGASIALGRDMGDALDRLTRGVTKLEPELIDELGILTKAQEAYKKYATQLGISVDDMSSAQKSQAYLNAVLDEGTRKWASLAAEMGANPFQRLLSGLKDMGTKILGVINTVLGPVVDLVSKSETLIFALIAGITAKLATMALPTLTAGRSKYLKEAADLVTEQNTLKMNAEKALNAGLIESHKALQREKLIAVADYHKREKSTLVSNASNVGNKAIADRVSGSKNISKLASDPKFMEEVAKRQKEIYDKEESQSRRLADAKANNNTKSEAALARAIKATEKEKIAIDAVVASLKEQSRVLTEIEAKKASKGAWQTVGESDASRKNVERLKGANAKEKYISGETGFKSLFGELRDSANALDGIDGKTDKVTKSLNSLKAGFSTIALMGEKWLGRALSLFTGPWGIAATLLWAAIDPIKNMIGWTNNYTRAVEEGSDRVKEQVDNSIEAYTRMRGILAEATGDITSWGAAYDKFNVASTTKLNENLSEIKAQMGNIVALRADAEKGDFWGSKGRAARSAESEVKTKTEKSLTDFKNSGSLESNAQLLKLINQEGKTSFKTIDQVIDSVKTLNGAPLSNFIGGIEKASNLTKSLAKDMEEATSRANTLTKDFDADFSKAISKKDFSHIDAPFRGIVGRLDELDEGIKRYQGSLSNSVGGEAKLNVLRKERAVILENLLANEKYVEKLGSEAYETLQKVVLEERKRLEVIKLQEESRTRLSKIDTSNNYSSAQSIDMDTGATIIDVAKAAEEASTKILALRGEFTTLYKQVSDPKASLDFKSSMITSLEAVIEKMGELIESTKLLALLGAQGFGDKDARVAEINKIATVLTGIRNKSKSELLKTVSEVDKGVVDILAKTMSAQQAYSRLDKMTQDEKTRLLGTGSASDTSKLAGKPLEGKPKGEGKEDSLQGERKIIQWRKEIEALQLKELKTEADIGFLDESRLNSLLEEKSHTIDLQLLLDKQIANKKENKDVSGMMLQVAQLKAEEEKKALDITKNELVAKSALYGVEKEIKALRAGFSQEDSFNSIIGADQSGIDSIISKISRASQEQAILAKGVSSLTPSQLSTPEGQKKNEELIEKTKELTTLDLAKPIVEMAHAWDLAIERQEEYLNNIKDRSSDISSLRDSPLSIPLKADARLEEAGAGKQVAESKLKKLEATTPIDKRGEAYFKKLRAAQLEVTKATRAYDSALRNVNTTSKKLVVAAQLDEIGEASNSLSKSFKSLGDAIGGGAKEIFDGLSGISDGFAGMSKSTANYHKESALLEEQAADYKTKILADESKGFQEKSDAIAAYEAVNVKERTRLETEHAASVLNGFGSMAGAAASMFEENSKEAQFFHNLQMGFMVAEMAMKLQTLTVALFAQKTEATEAVASIPPKAASGAASMWAQSGWAAFAGIAAMVAVIASLSGGKAKGATISAPTPEQLNAKFGDRLDEGKADTGIRDVYESLREANTDTLVPPLLNLLVELKQINQNTKAAAVQFKRGVGLEDLRARTGDLGKSTEAAGRIDPTAGGSRSFFSSKFHETWVRNKLESYTPESIEDRSAEYLALVDQVRGIREGYDSRSDWGSLTPADALLMEKLDALTKEISSFGYYKAKLDRVDIRGVSIGQNDENFGSASIPGKDFNPNKIVDAFKTSTLKLAEVIGRGEDFEGSKGLMIKGVAIDIADQDKGIYQMVDPAIKAFLATLDKSMTESLRAIVKVVKDTETLKMAGLTEAQIAKVAANIDMASIDVSKIKFYATASGNGGDSKSVSEEDFESFITQSLSTMTNDVVRQAFAGIDSSVKNTLGNTKSLVSVIEDAAALAGTGLGTAFLSLVTAQAEASQSLKSLGLDLSEVSWQRIGQDIKETDPKNWGAALTKTKIVETLTASYTGLTESQTDARKSLVKYFEALEGTSEEIVRIAEDLQDIGDQLETLNPGSSKYLSQDMLRGAGGTEGLQSGLSELLTDTYSSDEDILKSKTLGLQRRFDNIDALYGETIDKVFGKDFKLGIPSSAKDVTDVLSILTASFEQTGAKGEELYGALIALVPMISDILPEASNKAKEALEALTDALDAIKDATTDAAAELAQLNSGVDASALSGIVSSLKSSYYDALDMMKTATDAAKELYKSGPAFDKAIADINRDITKLVDILVDVFEAKISKAFKDYRTRLNTFGTEESQVTSGQSNAQAILQANNSTLNATLGTALDVASLPINELLTWSQTTAANISEQLKSGLISPEQAEAAMTSISNVVESKFSLIDSIQAAFDYHLQAASELEDQLKTIRDLSKSNKTKVAELKDKLASPAKGPQSYQYRLADIATNESSTRSKYKAALASGDTAEAIELAQELSELINSRYDLELEKIQEVSDKNTEYYQATKDFVKEITDYLDSLKLGDKSLLSPRKKVEEAMSQFNDTLAIINSSTATDEEKQTAMGQLTSKADTTLELAKDYNASGEVYRQIYDYITGTLEGVTKQFGTIEDPAIALQKATNTLIQSQITELDALGVDLTALETVVSTKLTTELDRLTTAMQDLLAQGISLSDASLEVVGALSTSITDLLPKGDSEVATASIPEATTPVSGFAQYAQAINSQGWNKDFFTEDFSKLSISGGDFEERFGKGATDIAKQYNTNIADDKIDLTELGTFLADLNKLSPTIITSLEGMNVASSLISAAIADSDVSNPSLSMPYATEADKRAPVYGPDQADTTSAELLAKSIVISTDVSTVKDLSSGISTAVDELPSPLTQEEATEALSDANKSVVDELKGICLELGNLMQAQINSAVAISTTVASASTESARTIVTGVSTAISGLSSGNNTMKELSTQVQVVN